MCVFSARSRWGEEPPPSAVKLVQHYVSQLRKLLAGGYAEIVTRGRGYELRVRADAVDVADFERLADAAARGGENGTAARRALSLWRGSPLLDVIDEPFAAAEQTVSRVGADGSKSVLHLGAPPSAIAIGAGAVWITSEETGTLFRVEPRTGTIVRPIRVGNRPVAVAAGPSGVWVVNRQDATVWRIDPATNSVSDTIPVGRDPSAVAVAGPDVWVAAADARVSRIDGRTRRVAERVELGNPATALAAAGTSVWVATQPGAAHHRGGTVTVATEDFPYSGLEAGAYDPQAQQVLSLVYDGSSPTGAPGARRSGRSSPTSPPTSPSRAPTGGRTCSRCGAASGSRTARRSSPRTSVRRWRTSCGATAPSCRASSTRSPGRGAACAFRAPAISPRGSSPTRGSGRSPCI